MRISLVTVAWHSAPWLEQMVPTAAEADEIVVVDHSEDAAEAARLKNLPVQRIVNAPNRGYGAGLNRGVRESSGEILVLTNPDVRFAPGSIGRLAALASRPGIGAAGPILLWSGDRPWQLPHSADYTWFHEWTVARFPRLARARYLRQMDRAWKARGPARVPVLGGAVIVTTRERFEAIGGFDERFFLFFEENDWCLRMRRSGSQLLVDPGATIHHDWGHAVGSGAGPHHARSLGLYRRLHLPRWYLDRHPSPPPAGHPPLPPAGESGCAAGEELLLVSSALCIPAARLVAPAAVPDVAALVPPSAAPGRYFVVRRRGGRLRLLRTVDVGGRG